MSVVFSNCMDCKYFRKVTDSGEYLCDAFPDGIPKDYMIRKNQDKETVCNNGIKFMLEE